MEKEKLDKCRFCKKVIEGNSKFFLKELKIYGFDNDDFCSKDCFLDHVLKTFKRQLKKKGFYLK